MSPIPRNRRAAAKQLREAAGHAARALACIAAARNLVGAELVDKSYSGAPVCPAAVAVLGRMADRIATGDAA